MRRLGPDVGRLGHEGARQRDDRVGHRRREQHGLPLVGDLLEDPLDIGQESQVEHFVGLVEDQHAESTELQVTLLCEVQQAARGADDDVDALLQRLDLRLIWASAVDRGDGQLAGLVGLQILGRGDQVTVHLDAKLPGRNDDQSARNTGQRPLGVGADPVQQGNAERERLAHAGAGLPDQVVAGQRKRKGQLLDREGVLDAVLGEGAHDLVADAELGECRCGVRCYGSHA